MRNVYHFLKFPFEQITLIKHKTVYIIHNIIIHITVIIHKTVFILEKLVKIIQRILSQTSYRREEIWPISTYALSMIFLLDTTWCFYLKIAEKILKRTFHHLFWGKKKHFHPERIIKNFLNPLTKNIEFQVIRIR